MRKNSLNLVLLVYPALGGLAALCFPACDSRLYIGDQDEVLELLGKSTAYVERTHLTMRLFSSRLTRKMLGFSKELEMYRDLPPAKISYTTSRVRSKRCAWKSMTTPTAAGNHTPLLWLQG
jgi:hypothetical protein